MRLCQHDSKLGVSGQVLFEAQGRSTKNKSVDLEDIKFHQCVRLARFENDRTIAFIPPDGNFDLMCVLPCSQLHACTCRQLHFSKGITLSCSSSVMRCSVMALRSW